jgi:hydrogenase maturation protease
MTLVVGLGQPDRGDDAVGLLVCGALEREEGVRVRALADASSLPAIWDGEDDVVVVDAVRDPSRTRGSVLVLELRDGVGVPHEGSTHGFDLAAVVSVAAAVGALPRRLHLVGVVGDRFGLGAAPGSQVRAAVPAAVDAVLTLVAAAPAAGLR